MTILPQEFYEDCLAHHREVAMGATALPGVVPCSIPIPFFGDVAAYIMSEVRVITVGLNPSDREFPANRPRFDIPRGLSGAEGLEATLGDYFKVHPYNGWFHSFEAVLSGLSASYYPAGSRFRKAPDQALNTALHLDVCSPIATDPTWSSPELPSSTRALLTARGNVIFRRLVDLLRPDIVIASVAAHHMIPFHPAFASMSGWWEILRHDDTVGGKRLPSPLLVRGFAPDGDSPHLIVLGSAANIPFGRFSGDRKRQAGAAILAHWRMLAETSTQSDAA